MDNDTVVACFERLLRSASRVVVVAGSYGETIAARFECAEKLHTVHLSYDGDMSKPKSFDGGVFSLVYAGTLNGGRSITPILEALVGAIQERPEMAACEVNLAGSGVGYDEAEKFVGVHNLSGCVHFRGVLCPDVVESLLKESDAILVVQPVSAALQVPGKIFESMKMCKPIIGLMPVDCETAVILRKSGVGVVHDENDIDGIKDTLIRLWDVWNDGKFFITPDYTFIRDFSTANLPTKIGRIIENLKDVPGQQLRNKMGN